jgi:hypothetical protein
MLAQGATIFDQDGMLQSADTTKRWCDISAHFPKQPSRSSADGLQTVELPIPLEEVEPTKSANNFEKRTRTWSQQKKL